MPMIRYKCQAPDCGAFFNLLIKDVKEIQPSHACKECGSLSKRTLSSPSSSSKIVVGRETQARQVEIYPDVVELNHERSRKGENRGD
jgi:uncharacterized Zn finger protein